MMHTSPNLTYGESKEEDDAFDTGPMEQELQRLRIRTTLTEVPVDDSPVIDVGCGQGSVANALESAGHLVIGIDIVPQRLVSID